MYKNITIGMAVIMAGIALTTMTTSTVFATSDEPDPNTVGKTNKQTNEDNRDNPEEPGASETGKHAKDPGVDTSLCGQDDKPGRCGLPLNRGQGNTEGSPQETICAVAPSSPGCP